MKIKWINSITNEKVLEKNKEKRTHWKNLKKKESSNNRAVKNEGLLRDILEGELEKKRRRGRLRLEYLFHIMKISDIRDLKK